MSTTDKRARLKQWLESGEAKLHPLTFPQRELWEASPVPPGHPTNHICSLIHVRGKLDERDCHDAMQRVVERQEALRLSVLPGKEAPLQMIRREVEDNLTYVELPAAERSDEAIEARAQAVYREPFDMLQGPLYRALVMKRSAEELVFAFAIHHAIADGWTLGVLVQDLAGAYVQLKTGARHAPLPAVPLTYSAWGASERALWPQAELDKRAVYWRQTLAGAPRPWPGHAGSASLEPLDRWVTGLSPELCAATRRLARQAQATLFSTLLTAFRLAFAQWTGQTDLVVGTPVANRNSQAVRETMGSYAGVVPLRSRVDPERPFTETVHAVHQDSLTAFAEYIPFVELVRAVNDPPSPGHHPVFEVRFALQNHPLPDINLSSLSAKLRMRSTGTARFHLGCEITEDGDSLEVVWLSRPALFARAEIEELDRLFEQILTTACGLAETAAA